MKTIALLSMIGATALTLTPAPARADSEGAAALGGFLGGLIVGQIFNDRDHRHGPAVSVEVNHRHHDHYDRHHGHGRHDHPHGYWDTVRVKVWVPGYWSTRYERGCQVRYHVPGRYEWRLERVWVSGHSHGYSSRSYNHRG